MVLMSTTLRKRAHDGLTTRRPLRRATCVMIQSSEYPLFRQWCITPSGTSLPRSARRIMQQPWREVAAAVVMQGTNQWEPN